MAEQSPPKIEFPCPDYPIKAMGESGSDFYQLVISVMEKHAPGFDASCIKTKDSRNGRFQSLTVLITATGEPQLKAIHQDLIASPLTKMVL